jgi:hypothetical protein
MKGWDYGPERELARKATTSIKPSQKTLYQELRKKDSLFGLYPVL